MPRAYTFCEDCDNVEPYSRRRSPYSWVCLKFPRTDGGGFVAPKVWTEMEPFMRCSGINGGLCPQFVARKMDITKEREHASTEE